MIGACPVRRSKQGGNELNSVCFRLLFANSFLAGWLFRLIPVYKTFAADYERTKILFHFTKTAVLFFFFPNLQRRFRANQIFHLFHKFSTGRTLCKVMLPPFST
ncbi:MAG TPA: hypothetical protein DC013_01055 [Ruminococcaceae bacterium]|nr:hypothetical protein [Oscillospiraceae bacterium]